MKQEDIVTLLLSSLYLSWTINKFRWITKASYSIVLFSQNFNGSYSTWNVSFNGLDASYNGSSMSLIYRFLTLLITVLVVLILLKYWKKRLKKCQQTSSPMQITTRKVKTISYSYNWNEVNVNLMWLVRHLKTRNQIHTMMTLSCESFSHIFLRTILSHLKIGHLFWKKALWMNNCVVFFLYYYFVIMITNLLVSISLPQ